MFVYCEPRSRIPTLSERVEPHPRRSPNSFLNLIPIPFSLSPNSDIPPAAFSPRSAIPLSPLECAVPDKHRVLLVFSRNRPHLSPLECAVPSPLVTTHSKRVAENANSFRIYTYRKQGGTSLASGVFLPALILRSFRSLHQECFTTLFLTDSSALFPKTAGCTPTLGAKLRLRMRFGTNSGPCGGEKLTAGNGNGSFVKICGKFAKKGGHGGRKGRGCKIALLKATLGAPTNR